MTDYPQHVSMHQLGYRDGYNGRRPRAEMPPKYYAGYETGEADRPIHLAPIGDDAYPMDY